MNDNQSTIAVFAFLCVVGFIIGYLLSPFFLH